MMERMGIGLVIPDRYIAAAMATGQVRNNAKSHRAMTVLYTGS